MTKEFATKLRASLEALDARISALEHMVNDTIIGGLKSAAEEYDDDVHYSEFVDKYSPKYEKFVEPYGIMYGTENELPSVLYETLKGAEGYGSEEFDEEAAVDQMLAAIQEKIDSLEALKEKVEEKADEKEAAEEEGVVEEEAEEIPDEEQLMKEFKGEY